MTGKPETDAPSQAAGIHGVDATSKRVRDIAPGQPAELRFTIFDKALLPLGEGDPVSVRMMDTTSLFTAAEWPALWPPPSKTACKRAFQVLTSYMLGFPTAPGSGPTLRTAPASPAEELTLLAASLETITDWNLRQWNVIHQPRRPGASAKHADHVASSKQINKHLDKPDEHARVADTSVRTRRASLVWAIGAVLWARDLLVHGRCIIYAVPRPPGDKLWWAASPGPLLPAAQALGMTVLEGAREDDGQLGFETCKRVSKALKNLTVQVSPEDTQEEFERIWRNPMASFQVITIARMTLLAGLAQNHDVGALNWMATIDRIAPGARHELTKLGPDKDPEPT